MFAYYRRVIRKSFQTGQKSFATIWAVMGNTSNFFLTMHVIVFFNNTLEENLVMLGKNKGSSIQSVQRAIDILECFPSVDTKLSLSEISQKTGLNPSTAHGILKTLCANYYIRQTSSRKYMIGYSLTNKFRYAQSINRAILTQISVNILKSLTEQEKITSNIYIVEDAGISLIHREVPMSGAYIVNVAEDRFNAPLYSTASGKLYLAHLNTEKLAEYFAKIDRMISFTGNTICTKEKLRAELKEIGRRGYAKEDEELSEGISAMAMPIYNPYKKMFATISVTSVTAFFKKEEGHVAEILKEYAKMIYEQMF